MNQLDERVRVKRVPNRNSCDVDEAQQHWERAKAKKVIIEKPLMLDSAIVNCSINTIQNGLRKKIGLEYKKINRVSLQTYQNFEKIPLIHC